MIVTVTLNPAFDKALTIDRLQPGALHRSETGPVVPSGKGINVARVARAWGVPVTALAFAGRRRELLAAFLESYGIKPILVPIEGDIRTNIKLFERQYSRMTEINEPGPRVSRSDIASLEKTLLSLCTRTHMVVFSGSLPPGVPGDFYAYMAQQVATKGVPVIVDTSGAALNQAVTQPLFAIKPNRQEAEELVKLPADTDPYQRDKQLLKGLLSWKIPHTMLTLGADGAYFAAPDGIIHTVPPPIAAGNAAGADDSFLATYLVGILEGWSLNTRAIRSTAAGAAASRGVGTNLATPADVMELEPLVGVTSLMQV